MSIVRASLHEGTPLSDPANLHIEVAKLLLLETVELKRLAPGQYDVTPEIWTTNTHQHELTVLDNDEGIYRLIPKNQDVGVIAASSHGQDYRVGGRTQVINSESPIAIIAGGHPRKQGMHIFGIIAHM